MFEPGGIVLEEQDEPGPQEEQAGRGEEDPEEAAVAQNGQKALAALAARAP